MSDRGFEDSDSRELMDWLHLQVVDLGEIPFGVNDYEIENPVVRLTYRSLKSDDNNHITLRGTVTGLATRYSSRVKVRFDPNQRQTEYYFNYKPRSSSAAVKSSRYDQMDETVGHLKKIEIVETPDPDADDDDAEVPA